jgi:hypothetical protein
VSLGPTSSASAQARAAGGAGSGGSSNLSDLMEELTQVGARVVVILLQPSSLIVQLLRHIDILARGRGAGEMGFRCTFLPESTCTPSDGVLIKCAL